jgi:CRISPR/Cas system-associated exonuclease Cas4 (RecB family)
MSNFAWSYTALTMFELCRKKYFHIKVAKDVKDDDSQFAGEGKLIHDSLKKRVIDAVPLPIELRYLEAMAAKFANAKGEKRGELQLALTNNYAPTTWFGKSVWVRVIIDLLVVNGTHALIVDYKTGKRREDWDQMKLAAAVLSQFMPEIEDFTATYIWTKSQEVSPPLTMKKEHMADVWSDFQPRIEEILEAAKTTTFPAEPNPLCKWCPVKQCPHHP